MKPFQLLLVVVLLASCADLVPSDYDKFSNNYSTLTIENDFHTVHMANMGSQYQHLVFDVEIINHSKDTIIFDPVSIVYYGSPSPFPVSHVNLDIHELTRPNAVDHKSYNAQSPQRVAELHELMQTGDPVLSSSLIHELFYDCEILPGERYRGKVFFSKPKRFRYYRFVIFIGQADYVFDFKAKSAPVN